MILIKKLFLTLVVCIPLTLLSQQTQYHADLAAMRSMLAKTPSYKDQIKGAKLKEYNALYDQLVAKPVENAASFDYFYQLCQLIFPLRDNHLGFYQQPDYNHFRSKASLDSFIATDEFKSFPRLDINIDSLTNVLAKKSDSVLEGIYHYDKHYSVGLFQSAERTYTGVVVNSNVSLWPQGSIVMRLYEQQPGVYRAIYAHPLTRNFIYLSVEKYVNESLAYSSFYQSYSNAVYSKYPNRVDLVNLPEQGEKFLFKQISPEVQYVAVRTFQLNPFTSRRSKAFLDSITPLLNATNVIIDLRNHEGGARSAAKGYASLVRKLAARGHVYLMVNAGTISQGEIFVLDLKRLKNVTVVGQTTKGMLTYGANYGNWLKLPSDNFQLYPTDMPGSSRLMAFEDKGIEPDIALRANEDWIKQVLEIIANKQPTNSSGN